MQVIILAGGLSAERDVSLRSGRRVTQALRSARPDWDVTERDVDASLLTALEADAPDCVIPLLHGSAGEDGAVRDVLECLGLPYVGSRPASCRIAFDKSVAKTLIRRAGCHTPASVTLPHATFRELGAPGVISAIQRGLGLPLVVKPARGGSALGVGVVHSPQDLPPAIVGTFAYGDVALLERFVSGTEVAIGVIESADGPRALPIVEIVPDGGLYDYAARYTAGSTEFHVPARLSPDVAHAAAELALQAHATLGLRDWSRTDLIIDSDGIPWFLEVNVAPGMTETSLVPQALAAAELDIGAEMATLVERAVARV
jgi:D-alanine-D-alanine ligase